mmetsp:Transcript_7283/g.6431  ORF Transcript_7283/g.6431 Transcript_7283/m.6431 type:complete len:84 (+) Transcript_7283:1859-2110(+)
MAHSAVQYDQYMVVFGGFNSNVSSKSLITNDLYVLSLDGSLGNMISQSEAQEAYKYASHLNSLDKSKLNMAGNKLNLTIKQNR